MVEIQYMAEALYQLRRTHGLYYNPSDREILELAIKIQKSAEK